MQDAPLDVRPPTLLVVDDDPIILRAITRLVSRQGFHVVTASSGEEALQQLDTEPIDVALVDHGLPGITGVEVIHAARLTHPSIDYIMLTGSGDVSIGFAALDEGASDYFTKPILDPERFLQVLRRGTEAKRLRDENAQLRRSVANEPGPADRLLVGNSREMEQVRVSIRRFARADETVLITGESGVGKDVVARSIHAESGRSGTFVPVNCGAIPPELFESQLFGHEAGAFTGTRGRHIGFFEEAGTGTLFLDEIGELPLELQVKLLRILENGKFRRVGAMGEIAFRGRVVAATNRDLSDMVKEKSFRQDLYFRLNLLQILVPPLRDHPDDIVILAYYFAKQYAVQYHRTIQDIHPDALRALVAYSWPGNIRELRNAVARMVLLSDGELIGPTGLDPAILQAAGDPTRLSSDATGPSGSSSAGLALPEALLSMRYRDAKKEAEQRFAEWYLTSILARSGGNKTHAAEASGLRRPNFCRELTKFGVERPHGNDEDD